MSQDPPSNDTPVLHTNPQSRGQVAHWMLEEIGVPYEIKIVEFGPAGMKAPAYLAINPMGKVPALQHRGRVVTETAAICAYLADAYPQAGLAPAIDAPERADYLRWLFFVAGPLESAMLSKSSNAQVDPVAAGYGRVEDVVDTLDRLLTGRTHIAGDRFTAADLVMAAYVGWYMQFKLLEARPSFEAYATLHRQRPAAQRLAAAAAAKD
ncbi:MAG: glutathione S-transferase [Burkholderiaceae bacterium]